MNLHHLSCALLVATVTEVSFHIINVIIEKGFKSPEGFCLCLPKSVTLQLNCLYLGLNLNKNKSVDAIYAIS